MDAFRTRIENFIYDSWKIFAHKAGNEVIHVNQEISMQLNYAYLLRKHIDLLIYDKREKVDIELEYALEVNGKTSIIDILIKTSNGKETLNIPLQLKCYREGDRKEVQDIFIENVYVNLENLEQYASLSHFSQGYALIMTDSKSLVYQSDASSKTPEYNISQGHEIDAGICLKGQTRNKSMNITLYKSYSFEWHQHGDFWFSLVQGI